MDNFGMVLGSFLGYTSMCGVLKFLIPYPKHLTSLEKWDYLGQHISFLHACLSVALSIYIYILEGGVNYNNPTNDYHRTLLAHTMGYLLYDMIYAEIFSFHDWSMRAHHIFVLIGGINLIYSEFGGSPATICIMLTEGTNPILKFNKIMGIRKQTDTKLYQFLEILFAALFTLFRAGFGTLVNFNISMSKIPLVTKLMMSSTYSVGLIWVVKVLHIGSKKIKSLSLLNKITSQLSKHKVLFAILCFIWGVLTPVSIQYFFKTEFFHFKINNFILL